MKVLWRVMNRLRGMLYGRKRDLELAEELELHIEMQTEDNIRAGMPLEEARRAARLKFGAMESVKETYRDQRGVPFLESLAADLRYGIRQLRRSPGFTATAVLTIALGIGANTAMFSVMNTILWKPLPIPESDRLVVLTTMSLSESGERAKGFSASPAVFAYWRTHSDTLEDVSAFLRTEFNYTGGDALEVWRGQRVSAGIFRTFRLRTLKGRTFTADEDRPNGPRVAVISKALWKRRFAEDPDITAKTVSLSGELYTIIGVVEDSNGVLEMSKTLTAVYVPFQLDPNTSELGQTFRVVGRLKSGLTLEQAREQLRISTDGYRAKFPKALGSKESFSAERYKDFVVNDGEDEGNADTYVIVGAVLMVLLIACVNVANLLLVRAANRRREIGIRIAIGAGRRRMIRQLLTECILLSAAGGAIGLLLGDAAVRSIIAANFTDLPAFWKFDIDWQVMAFTLAACAVTACLFGLLPALAGSRVDLNSTLKDSGGRWGMGLRQNKTRAALVISEVSLAVILLVASSLLIRSFISLRKVDLGFDAANVSVQYTWMNGSKAKDTASAASIIRSGIERIRTIPGVIAASSAGYVPLQGQFGLPFDIVGREPADGSSTGGAGWVPVSSGYFEVFKIPVKRGRIFTDRDDGKSPAVAVINEAMAKQYWKDADPLQYRISIGRGVGKDWTDSEVRQIVGIVGDVRQQGLSTPPDPRIYVPQAQLPDAVIAELTRVAPNAWITRTEDETYELSAAIQEQIRQATGLPVFTGGSMNEIVASSIEVERFILIIMTAFASMAVFLAAVGVYGVMSYTVQKRTAEIGIRMALGAEASQVRNMVVRHGAGLTLAGVIIGLAVAWELAQLMQGLVFGIRPRDTIVFTFAPLFLSSIALLAVWIPATRASRVNPMESLRCE